MTDLKDTKEFLRGQQNDLSSSEPPIFDPQLFQAQHQELTILDWILSEERLTSLGEEFTAIRRIQMEKVHELSTQMIEINEQGRIQRSREGLKLSTYKTNLDGLKAKELDKIEQLNIPASGKYRKRKLMELSVSEKADIVLAVLVDFEKQ